MKVDLPEVVFGWNYGVQQEHSVLEMTALHEVQKSVIKTDTLDGPHISLPGPHNCLSSSKV